jgi:hypothetical protein
MTGATIIVAVLVVAVVAGLGLLIFRLQRRAQDVVPRAAEAQAARRDRIVAVDTDGSGVAESRDAADGPARDPAAFERVLAEELETRHRPEADEAAGGTKAADGLGGDDEAGSVR